MSKRRFDARKGRVMDRIIEVVLDDLREHFADLDDSEEAMFGDFARTSVVGNVLTVLHETQPLGVTVTVERIGGGEETVVTERAE